MPSRPSAEPRISAICFAVSATSASSGRRPATARIGLDLGVRLRAAGKQVLPADRRWRRPASRKIREAKACQYSFRGVNFRRQEIAPRLALAHGAHHVGTDGRRREPELGFRQAHLRLRRADRDVARGDQPGAAGEHRAVHARDGRFRQAVEGRQHLGQPLGIGEFCSALARHALHPVEIGAGAERRAVPGEDHDANVGAQLRPKALLQLANERVVDDSQLGRFSVTRNAVLC